MSDGKLYSKSGSRYYPIKGLYDGPAFPQGFSVVYVNQDCRTTRFNVQPELINREMLVAKTKGEVCELLVDLLIPSLSKECESNPVVSSAWKEFCHKVKKERVTLFYESRARLAELIVESIIPQISFVDRGK